jgi:UTP-glucose-1-phosphate uridylyltransferase
MTIRMAVLPVAGFGTRVLPATQAIPKELLPAMDRPALQYVADEARAAGIEHIVFVTGRGKGAIEDYFDIAFELEDALAKKGKSELLAELERLHMPAGAGGEIQLTDAMATLMASQPFHALEYDGQDYDCGSRLGYLEAVLAYARDHPEIGPHARKLIARMAG